MAFTHDCHIDFLVDSKLIMNPPQNFCLATRDNYRSNVTAL